MIFMIFDFMFFTNAITGKQRIKDKICCEVHKMEEFMGLDLYIEARIINRKTKQVISIRQEDTCSAPENKGFFELCWWCGWEFLDLRKKFIELCNKYSHSHYSDSDLIIPIPQTTLREIYLCILNNAYLTEESRYEWERWNSAENAWEMRDSYESMNLLNAAKLHDLIRNLHEIEHYNEVRMEKNVIFAEEWENFIKNPQEFQWEFRIFNSY